MRTFLVKAIALGTFLLLLAISGGCLPSHSLAPAHFNDYWSLTANPVDSSTLQSVRLGEKVLPTQWTIRQNPSLVRSTISIVRAVDQIEQGTDSVEFSVSPAQARELESILAETRQSLESLAQLDRSDSLANRIRWSQTMADILAKIEHIIRMSSLEETQTPLRESAEPMGLAAEPFLAMVSLYLNERSGGSLLEDLDPAEIEQLRTVLTQITLRLGFEIIGKTPPANLHTTASEQMRNADNLADLESGLKDRLFEEFELAPLKARETELGAVLSAVLNGAPKALRLMESFMAQWHHMDSIKLELRQLHDEPLFLATINVLPKKEVRMANLTIFQPDLVFRGQSQIAVLPQIPVTDETVVLFEPLDHGAVDLRFEGIIYSLARLFAFPLHSGRLREVRVSTHTPPDGTELIHVAMFMEATPDQSDPRRMLMFQNSRKKLLHRQAFSLQTTEQQKQMVFHYLTPQRRYTYQRPTPPSD